MMSLTDYPPEIVRAGVMEIGTASHGSRAKGLMLRQLMSSPGMGLMNELYQPSIVDVDIESFRVRGFEPVDDAGVTSVVMQEWLVFPFK